MSMTSQLSVEMATTWSSAPNSVTPVVMSRSRGSSHFMALVDRERCWRWGMARPLRDEPPAPEVFRLEDDLRTEDAECGDPVPCADRVLELCEVMTQSWLGTLGTTCKVRNLFEIWLFNVLQPKKNI